MEERQTLLIVQRVSLLSTYASTDFLYPHLQEVCTGLTEPPPSFSCYLEAKPSENVI